MALTFGKGNRSIAFNPTSAFPLDARSYFESYELAKAAAASAKAASSTDTQYYFGQDIVVVENGTASFYIIQPDGTLGEVGGKVEINENVFEYVNNKLNLYGFADAVAGAQLVKDNSGKLAWIKPSGTTVEGLDTRVGAIEQDLANNYYTKEQTNAAIAAAPHLKRKVVQSTESIDLDAADADQYIYMVPSGLLDSDNKYYEYILVVTTVTDDENIETVLKTLERVGSWEVDLKDYAKKSDLDNVITTQDLSLEEIERLSNIPDGAEANYIKGVNDEEFTVSESGVLSVNSIAKDKISGLNETLDNKVSKIDGKGLSSNDFTDDLKEKVDNINLADIANMKTTVGTLSDTIYGYLDDDSQKVNGIVDDIAIIQKTVGTLNQRADKADGNIATLVSRADKADEKIISLEQNFKTLDQTYVSIADFNTAVGDLDVLLAKQKNIINEIADINERLTWGDIPENNI